MTTRQSLRSLCRRRLGDSASPTHWSDLQINQWINDAIAEHSIHFPRLVNETIACSDDDRTYDLPFNFLGAVSVEYPAGHDPPQYIFRREHTRANFWEVNGYYDIVRRDDSGDVDEIWISEKPTTGEEIEVIYSSEHAFLDDDSDQCTVLDRHLELIVLFVRWTAYQELAAQESADPDPTSQHAAVLALNVHRAGKEYQEALKGWLAAEAESATAVWSMDAHDRIY